ncbi:MAG: hypothetical protein ACYDHH_17470 [Solirubrobacteraceae bacterium]
MSSPRIVVLQDGSSDVPGIDRLVTALADAGIEVDHPANGATGGEVVLLGTGYDGGRILELAAGDARVAAVIAVAPIVDGRAQALATVRRSPLQAISEFKALAQLAREHRPIRYASQLRCPILIQVADEDPSDEVASAMRAAWIAGADVRHYPCDRSEMLGAEHLERVVEHQLVFLRRRLSIPDRSRA